MHTGRPHDDSRQILLGSLARRFELIDDECLASACAELGEAHDDLGEILVAWGRLTRGQVAMLRPLVDLLAQRERDRRFAQRALDSGLVGGDEIAYAFSAQEAAFRRDGTLRSVGDLLVEFGAFDEGFRDELLAQMG
jgi:hypothetical protein